MKRILTTAGVFVAGGATMWLSGQVAGTWEKMVYKGHGLTVIRSEVAPHMKTDKHSHSGRLQIILTDGEMRNFASDGTVKDVHLTKGTVVWADPMTHMAENIGSTSFEELDVIPDNPKK